MDLVESDDVPFRPARDSGTPWLTFDQHISSSVFVSQVNFNPDKHAEKILVPKQVNDGFDLFRLWDNLMDMLAHYPKNNLAGDAAFAYAVVDLSDYGLPLPSDDTIQVLTSRTMAPAKIDDWPLLGYDIASAYFISALAGYRHKNSSTPFIHRIKENLNQFGLISSNTAPDKLADIVQSTNAEINEDPFFPIALYLLWGDDSLTDSRH